VVINLALTGMCTYVSALDNGLQESLPQRSIYLCTLLHKCMLFISKYLISFSGCGEGQCLKQVLQFEQTNSAFTQR